MAPRRVALGLPRGLPLPLPLPLPLLLLLLLLPPLPALAAAAPGPNLTAALAGEGPLGAEEAWLASLQALRPRRAGARYAIYSVLTGGYDRVWRLPAAAAAAAAAQPVDFYLLTDDAAVTSRSWPVVRVPPLPAASPAASRRLASRALKLRSTAVFAGYDATLYLDANAGIKDSALRAKQRQRGSGGGAGGNATAGVGSALLDAFSWLAARGCDVGTYSLPGRSVAKEGQWIERHRYAAEGVVQAALARFRAAGWRGEEEAQYGKFLFRQVRASEGEEDRAGRAAAAR